MVYTANGKEQGLEASPDELKCFIKMCEGYVHHVVRIIMVEFVH